MHCAVARVGRIKYSTTTLAAKATPPDLWGKSRLDNLELKIVRASSVVPANNTSHFSCHCHVDTHTRTNSECFAVVSRKSLLLLLLILSHNFSLLPLHHTSIRNIMSRFFALFVAALVALNNVDAFTGMFPPFVDALPCLYLPFRPVSYSLTLFSFYSLSNIRSTSFCCSTTHGRRRSAADTNPHC